MNKIEMYKRIIYSQADYYDIEVVEKFKGESGRALYDERIVQIPIINSDNIHKFMIAMHEIGHIIHGRFTPVYMEEFCADRYALGWVYDLYHTKYISAREVDECVFSSRGWILTCVATAFNRSLKLDDVPDRIFEHIKVPLHVWEKAHRAYVYSSHPGQGWHKGYYLAMYNKNNKGVYYENFVLKSR